MCSCYLMPLAFMFSKIVKADIFKKNSNPICKLGFLCTMNQMLYLIIVMWAFNRSPEAMLMLYAMVFGAHLLPFGWVYNSLAYKVAAILETVGALLIALTFGNAATCVFMIVMEIILCICLFIESKKVMDQFAISFKSRFIQKRGFIFSLTVAYILFIPVEILMFYLMGIFSTGGNLISWIIFGGIVVMAYIISVLVDVIVMRKNAEIYTTRMHEYISKKS